jgi:hypothetical protein
VPWVSHYDAYRNRLVRTWRAWGNANPLRRQLAKMRHHPPPNARQTAISRDEFLSIVAAGIQASADNRHPLLFDDANGVVPAELSQLEAGRRHAGCR